MNLVVGATGMLGSEICRRLAAEGKPVRALVRTTSDPDKVDGLKGYGAEIVQGDLRDLASLKAACQGATAVISTAFSASSYQPGENDIQSVDLEGTIGLIDAAQAAGVQRFVYTSFSGKIDLDFPMRNAKRAVEKHLKESGLVYTILRPTFYAEMWLSPALGFDSANAKARIYGMGKEPISWISFQDVAQFAVACLNKPAAHHATLELGGPEALSPLEVVRIFEDVSGKPFEIEHIPEQSLAEQQQTAADALQQSFAGLMRCYARGAAIDMQATLETFPLQLISVREYAQRTLGAS